MAIGICFHFKIQENYYVDNLIYSPNNAIGIIFTEFWRSISFQPLPISYFYHYISTSYRTNLISNYAFWSTVCNEHKCTVVPMFSLSVTNWVGTICFFIIMCIKISKEALVVEWLSKNISKFNWDILWILVLPSTVQWNVPQCV